MSDDNQRSTFGIGRAPRTALERSLRPSCLLTAVVLVLIVALFRVRLPPLPYSLVVVAGVALLCFLLVLGWQARRSDR